MYIYFNLYQHLKFETLKAIHASKLKNPLITFLFDYQIYFQLNKFLE